MSRGDIALLTPLPHHTAGASLNYKEAHCSYYDSAADCLGGGVFANRLDASSAAHVLLGVNVPHPAVPKFVLAHSILEQPGWDQAALEQAAQEADNEALHPVPVATDTRNALSHDSVS